MELIADIARLYHEEKLNLREIGEVFDLSPSSVSRLLKKAEELKIVEVVIRYPFLTVPTLGKQLQRHLGLREAYVLPDFRGSYDELIERVGRLSARVLEDHLEDGMTLGISLGQTVACTARNFFMARRIHCQVVRLHGANDDEMMENANLAQIFAAQMGNVFKIIPSPFFFKNRNARELIVQEPPVREGIRIAESSDIALIGIGSMNYSVSTLIRNRLISSDELEQLVSAGAVGEICGKYYDSMGETLDVEFNQRSVSIDLDKLREIDTVIGVAAGSAKVQSILGAARGRLIDILVTDANTANQLLSITL